MMPVSVRFLGPRCWAPALLLCALSVSAQEGRDPTVAPGESAAVSPVTLGEEGMTVLVRDDKPYLVVGTRLYAVGEKVGVMRVDRITESEVWLHDGRAQIKVPRFAGIERRAVMAKPACAPAAGAPVTVASAPAPAKAAKKTVRASAPPPVTAPCEDTQP